MRVDATTVLLMRQTSYDAHCLDATVEKVLAPFTAARNLRSAQVLLKPNLITARNGSLACTDGRWIAAVARWLLEQGAHVTVGDSPAFGSAHSVLAAIGALPALERLGVAVAEFNETREVLLPSGGRAGIARAALECDLLVNLPKIKAHGQMRLTLAIKNLFGCLAGLQKPWWHMRHGGAGGGFADLLVELLSVLPAGCTLADGIVAMHRTGPIHGEPYSLGVVAAGLNPVAIDTALLALLRVDFGQSPLWCAARHAGLAGTELYGLTFPLATPEELAAPDFVVPEGLEPIRFQPLRFLTGFCKRTALWVSGR